MAFRGQMLDNPITGERIIFRETSEDTGGERLVFDLILTPGGRVPAPHVHPEQEERFTVTRGTMRFWRGLERVTARAGTTVVIPPGAVHQFANGSDEPAHVRVEVTPALKMEALLEVSAALAREGRTFRSGMPKPLDMALFLRQFEREAGVPLLPPIFVRRATGPLAWLAKAQGRNRRYERKATETQPGKKSRFALTSQHLLLLTGESGVAWIDAAHRVSARLHLMLNTFRVAEGEAAEVRGAWLESLGVTPTGAVMICPHGRVSWRAEAAEADPEGTLERVLNRLQPRHLHSCCG